MICRLYPPLLICGHLTNFSANLLQDWHANLLILINRHLTCYLPIWPLLELSGQPSSHPHFSGWRNIYHRPDLACCCHMLNYSSLMNTFHIQPVSLESQCFAAVSSKLPKGNSYSYNGISRRVKKYLIYQKKLIFILKLCLHMCQKTNLKHDAYCN